jgi:hypothetical protein
MLLHPHLASTCQMVFQWLSDGVDVLVATARRPADANMSLWHTEGIATRHPRPLLPMHAISVSARQDKPPPAHHRRWAARRPWQQWQRLTQ